MNYLENFELWRNAGLPADVCRELDSLVGQEDELKGRFGSDLQFGTAGMRGIMGAGSNRLNRYTVRRAAQGMAAWLNTTDLPQKAAIASHPVLSFSRCMTDHSVYCYLFQRTEPVLRHTYPHPPGNSA